ncbi:MAG: protein translocase subunit SecF [Ignavibacteria bacterium]|nr:protein translocase subunit SecF [Ignavibacteria bacterium]
MDLIKKTDIDFVTPRNKFFMASAILTVVGAIAIFFAGVDLGIDFTGGTQITVKFQKNTATTEDIRAALGTLGFGNAELKSFGSEGEFLIRVQSVGNASQVSQDMVTGLQTKFSTDVVELLGADNVESKISSELAWESAIALVVSFLVMLIYVAFRFEFVYGLGSIVALLHDVTMAFIISVIFNKTGLLNLEFNINAIAAYLTILGYSINDKVVVFDRIRENREKHKGMPLSELVNLSINETLSRTLITGVSVLAALLVLVFFGGDVLEGFAFTMFVGIVVGTYSSIYIAASFVIWYSDRIKHKRIGHVHSAKG